MIYGWDAGVRVLEMVADTLKKNTDARKEVYAINQGERFVLLLNVEDEERFVDCLVHIKKEIEKDFRECVGDPISKHMEVEYVFQELNKVPEDFTIPEGR